jgi:hypothetical protein
LLVVIGGLRCNLTEVGEGLDCGFLSRSHWARWNTGATEITKLISLGVANGEWPLTDSTIPAESFSWSSDFERLHCTIAPREQSVASSMLRGFTVAAWQVGGFLIHAAGIRGADARAVMALAPSGGGKSTLTDLAGGFCSLSDETLLVRGTEVYGTPFRSSARKPPEPRRAPISAILILEKSSSPRYFRVAVRDALSAMLPEIYRPPREIASSAEILHRAHLLAESVPAYCFRFPKSPAANDLLTKLFDEELSK